VAEAAVQAAERIMMKGNEAVAAGAIAGGCRYFFAYPITPQNQIPEYMARHLPEVGGVFLQAESEIASINMVFGAAGAGGRAMTTSSGPGISLKQEGLSYIIGARLPCLIVNMVRGGPGLGNIASAQSDYWLATRGGGHGDGRCLVLAPASAQELYDMAYDAWPIAEKYRNPVLILADAMLGQMMEPVQLREPRTDFPQWDWSVGGPRHGRKPNLINSLYAVEEDLEEHNQELAAVYAQAAREITKWEEYGEPKPQLLLVSYGSSARVSQTAVDWAREQGLSVGLVRPQTLFPFPSEPVRQLAEGARHVLAVEMSMGQLVEDVRLAVEGRCPVSHFGRTGGMLTTPETLLAEMQRLLGAC